MSAMISDTGWAIVPGACRPRWATWSSVGPTSLRARIVIIVTIGHRRGEEAEYRDEAKG